MFFRFCCSLAFYLCLFQSFAQTQPQNLQQQVNRNLCLTDTVMERESVDPEFLSKQQAADFATATAIRNAEVAKGGEAVYVIPVVFHIIHKGEPVGTGTNLSSAQVESAIEALNRDYGATSADGGIAQSSDPTAAGNTNIQFCLASVDPSGNPTTGINRVNGTSVFQYDANGITSTNEVAIKNLSRWDNRYYMNVWVVSEIDGNNGDLPNPNFFAGGTLGYAYYPTLPIPYNSEKDGIVVVNVCVGNDPNGTHGFRLWQNAKENRTLTHEVGHFLNLRHTFIGESCYEQNCNLQGDLVCDTPPTVFNYSCNSPACSGNQQIENYLDYTTSCSEMFTEGQKERMRATLAEVRTELVNNQNCTPGTVPPPSPPVANFFASPTSGFVNDQIALHSTSTGQISSYSWSISPGSQGSHWQYVQGSQTSANPVVKFLQPGNYNIALTAVNDGGSNTKTRNNYISIQPVPQQTDCQHRNTTIELYLPGTSIMVAQTTVVADITQNLLSLPLIDLGLFDVVVTVDGYLSAGYTSINLLTSPVSVNISGLLCGDFDGSNGININDLSVISSHFNTSAGQPNFYEPADVNCDDGINIADFSVVIAGFNATGATAPLP